MKKTINFILITFIVALLSLSFISCGNESAKIDPLVGLKYGMEAQNGPSPEPNRHIIEFQAGGKFIRKYKLSNEYQEFYKGDYTVNGKVVSCRIAWINTNISRDQSLIGTTVSFNIVDDNKLQQSEGAKTITWNKL